MYGKGEQIVLLVRNSKAHFDIECTTSHQFAVRKIVSDNSLPLILDLHSDNGETKFFFSSHSDLNMRKKLGRSNFWDCETMAKNII